MCILEQTFIELFRKHYDDITIEGNHIRFPYISSEIKLQIGCQNFWISLSFREQSIVIHVIQQAQPLYSQFTSEIFELLHMANLSLDNGSLIYDYKSNLIYYSTFLICEGLSSHGLIPLLLNTVALSIKAYEEFLIKLLEIIQAGYQINTNLFEKNFLEFWIEKNQKEQESEEISMKDDDDSFSNNYNSGDEDDFQYLEGVNPIFINDRSAVITLKKIPKVWNFCDIDNFDVNTLEYSYFHLESLPYRLKKYTLSDDYFKDVINFMMMLKNADIEFVNLPVKYFMGSVNEKNEICNFKFALNLSKPLKKDKRLVHEDFKNLEKYEIYLREGLIVAAAKSLDENYASKYFLESLLRLDDFDKKNFTEMSEIGEGGFGKVYLNNFKNKQVAIKRPNNNKEAESLSKDRILREYNILKQFSNKYIVKAEGVIEIDKQLCLVMESCTGKSLKSNLSKIQPNEKPQIMKKIATAICEIHEKRIIHCDLKPSNILFSDVNWPNPKIIDFGLAVKADGVDKRTGFTKDYADPDQLIGKSVDWASDIWSYGMTFFYLLESKAPFSGIQVGNDKMDLYKKITDEGYRPNFSKEAKDKYSEEITIIEKCWKTDRKQRINAHDVLNKIQDIEYRRNQEVKNNR
ncbi:hypothetical protein SteCoe_28398 [Stentor coeruleus]|uniref:Protein kinase domain-containing protein n=1 Tax=Stentor coeruleus TaxID=5963 RepID=A0A1R2B8B5_9CILI|nr:hypothetical protein SteCoe_28398 [Stentor coeruleus]